MNVGRYAKFIVAAVVAGATALTVALDNDTLTATEAINIVLAVLGALGVYAVPNTTTAGRHE